jgi:arginase family enzyme
MSFDSRHKSKFDGRIGLLKIFAGIINPSDKNEIDITLSVHGTIVYGKMIGMKRYYEEIGKVFIDAITDTSPENTSPSKEVLTMLFEKIEQLNQKELEDGEFEFNYIFMRNTKIYNGGKVIPSTGTTYWIEKIESVDGFFLGMV